MTVLKRKRKKPAKNDYSGILSFVSIIYFCVGLEVFLSDEIDLNGSIDVRTYFRIFSITWLLLSILIPTVLILTKVFKTKKNYLRKLFMGIFYYQSIMDIGITITLFFIAKCDDILNVYFIFTLCFSKSFMWTVNKCIILIMVFITCLEKQKETKSVTKKKNPEENLSIESNV